MSKLTAADRNSLPKSTFGIPSKRAYPMPDKSHARFAKAMASKYASPSERAAIFAKANRILGRANGGMIACKPHGKMNCKACYANGGMC